MDPKTDVQAAIEAGRGLNAILPTEEHDKARVIVPAGASVATLALDTERPARKQGGVCLHTVAAFNAYVERHEAPGAVVYCDARAGRFVAVLNDHEADLPGHGDFRAAYAPALSEAWKAWAPLHRREVPQAKLIDLLEDRIEDVAEPDAADLVETLRDLKGKKNASWRSGVDLRTGAMQLEYVEEIAAQSQRRGQIEVPSALTIAIPVYAKEDRWEVNVRLRYRIDGGNLTFVLVMESLDRVKDKAFETLREQVAAGLAGVLLLDGESPALKAGGDD